MPQVAVNELAQEFLVFIKVVNGNPIIACPRLLLSPGHWAGSKKQAGDKWDQQRGGFGREKGEGESLEHANLIKEPQFFTLASGFAKEGTGRWKLLEMNWLPSGNFSIIYTF